MSERFDIPQERGLRLELLVGRVLTDARGKRVGRIVEIIGERTASECLLSAVLVAPNRLPDFFWLVISALGRHHDPSFKRVEWSELDLSDPKHPRLK
jgi:hypothetical protein